MIRETRFLISHKGYAINLATVTGEQQPRGDRAAYNFNGRADAVWYRRQSGVTRACIGTVDLFSHNLPHPLDLNDPTAILTADLDGRYGGDCHGRWDGTSYWGNVSLEEQQRHLAILRPMLAHYPDVPPGYDGWWTFHTKETAR